MGRPGDKGFGTSPFGRGPFGRAHYERNVLWDEPVPEGTKNDDTSGDLEAVLADAGVGLYRRMRQLLGRVPAQRDPLKARSGAEAAATLEVESVARDGPTVTLTVVDSDDQRDLLEWMFPQSKADASDGWTVAFDRRHITDVERVDAWHREVDVATERDLQSKSTPFDLEVRPPDLLEPLAAHWHVEVDERDPPDYTRRAIYRQSLVRDLKVSQRMFSLLGDIYGFDVDVQRLWCTTKAVYDRLKVSDPGKVFAVEWPPGSGRTQYLTLVANKGHHYDEVPADVIPMDFDGSATWQITTTSATNVGASRARGAADRWRLTVDPADRADAQHILDDGHWWIEHPGGDRDWVEDVAADGRWIEVWSQSKPPTGAATIGIDAVFQCSDEWRPAPAYHVEIEPAEVTAETNADTADLKRRMSRRIDKYIPIHIKLTVERFASSSRVVLPWAQVGPSTSTSVQRSSRVFMLEDDRYDTTDADVQPMDTDHFEIRTSFTSY